MYSQKKEKD